MAEQLSALAPSFQGATGSAAGSVRVRNVGLSACALQGVPTLTGYGVAGQLVADSRLIDSFRLHPWVVVQPRGVAAALVQIFGDESRCVGPVARLAMDIGHGQPVLSVTPKWVGGSGVQPRCATDEPNRLRNRYDISVGEWRHRNGGPRLEDAYADAKITAVPTTVMQGSILHYRVTLADLATSPCLPFREVLRGAYGAGLTEQTFLLDCNLIDTLRTSDVVLSMRLAVPAAATPGDAELTWELPVGEVAEAPSTIRILAAPAPCTQAQLRITAGSQGAAGGSFYDAVVFRNVSPTACSLRGYPGVQYVAPDGSALPTYPDHRSDIPVRTLSLAPGRAVSAMLAGSDFGANGGATPCPHIAGVRIIAPGLTTQVLVRTAMDCNRGRIQVTSVQPGARPSP